jgi:hypothetical protein
MENGYFLSFDREMAFVHGKVRLRAISAAFVSAIS